MVKHYRRIFVEKVKEKCLKKIVHSEAMCALLRDELGKKRQRTLFLVVLTSSHVLCEEVHAVV